jgi:hypothetical protein
MTEIAPEVTGHGLEARIKELVESLPDLAVLVEPLLTNSKPRSMGKAFFLCSAPRRATASGGGADFDDANYVPSISPSGFYLALRTTSWSA